jgi:hypothetical protein
LNKKSCIIGNTPLFRLFGFRPVFWQKDTLRALGGAGVVRSVMKS